MVVYSVEFEWDLFKERENLRKHGIAFIEAVETFSDPDGFQLSDTKHSAEETRFYWVGKVSIREDTHNAVYTTWECNPDFWIGIMEKILEALQ
jgi:uncharacterized DUF497 family protein